MHLCVPSSSSGPGWRLLEGWCDRVGATPGDALHPYLGVDLSLLAALDTCLGPETGSRELHGFVHCYLPGDCAYRNDFFVKIHDREPAFAPGLCFITFLLEQKEVAHYCSSASRFLMDQESNKHFVQIEKPALLSEDTEVGLPGEGLSQAIKDSGHKAGWRR